MLFNYIHLHIKTWKNTPETHYSRLTFTKAFPVKSDCRRCAHRQRINELKTNRETVDMNINSIRF